MNTDQTPDKRQSRETATFGRRWSYMTDRMFEKTWAIFAILLFGVTWKLWTPQDVFPQVPWWSVLRNVPAGTDWILFTTLFCSLIGCLFLTPKMSQSCRFGFIAATVLLSLINQHRTQPWVLQLVAIAILLNLRDRQEAKTWMRYLLISIYLYAGISKLDYQFVHSLGQEFVQTGLRLTNLVAFQWFRDHPLELAFAIPVAETLLGIVLLFRKTWRWSVWLACLFHFAIIMVVGPFGLNHKPAVVLWNVFFIAQLGYLFRTASTVENQQPRDLRPSWGLWLVRLAIGFVILFPATRFLGICDHWPAWELYAPRSSRVELEIYDLPEELEWYAKPAGIANPVDLQQMSLDLLGVPIYPQDRFQLGVAIDLIEKHGLEDMFQVTVKSESNRFSGHRDRQVFRVLDELFKNASTYRFNALPSETFHDRAEIEFD